MCTFRGRRYLADQMDSFEVQTHVNWQLWVSDDGSDDETLPILDTYAVKWGLDRLTLVKGPAKGFAANFLSLTCRKDIDADYYAYSDQDDIWEADKLERAVRLLQDVPNDVPALYCSRTRLVDMENNEIGLSPLFSKPPTFANALMQNIGGGNTMVFNEAAKSLLSQAGDDLPVITHDWWVYMAITGCGGQVLYDNYPSLRYRQHGGNLIGMNVSWAARFKRIKMLWQGHFRSWNDGNILSLRKLYDRLTPENRNIFDQFARARDMRLIPRLFCLKRSGVCRQTLLGNIGLIVAAAFKRI